MKQVDSYIFVKDPWSGSSHLPVYVGTRQVEEWSSVEITSVTATIAGQRIVAASQLRQYLTPNGMPFIMIPKGMDEPYEWATTTDGISTALDHLRKESLA